MFRIAKIFFLLSTISASVFGQPFCAPDDLELNTEAILNKVPAPKIWKTSRGNLPQNWTYQLTGADLVETNRIARVGLIDKKEDSHIDEVRYVYESADPSGEVEFLLEFKEMEDSEVFRQKIESAKASGKLPRFVGISFAMGNGEEVRKSLEILRENNVIVIASSGNQGDEALHPNNLREGVINIGSLGVSGLAASYSQKGSFYAPTGDEIYIEKNGQGFLMGGTSYAQPQVLAALGLVDAYLPGISEVEVRKLLAETSLQGVDGRALNHFKIVEVAKQLSSSWPSNRSKIMSDSSIFDFRAEAENLISDSESIDNLRRAYFLDSTRDDLRLRLIAAYEEMGFQNMASYFKAFDPSVNRRMAYVESLANSTDVRERAEAQRSLRHLPESDSSLIQLVASERAYIRHETLASLGRPLARKFSPELRHSISQLTQSSDQYEASLAWQVIERNPKQFPTSDLQSYFNPGFSSSFPSVRRSALIASIPYQSDIEIPSFTQDQSWAVKSQAMLGGASANNARKYLNDEDVFVREQAAQLILETQADPFLPYIKEAQFENEMEKRRELIGEYLELSEAYKNQKNNQKFIDLIFKRLPQHPWLAYWRASLASLQALGKSRDRLMKDVTDLRTKYSLNFPGIESISLE